MVVQLAVNESLNAQGVRFSHAPPTTLKVVCYLTTEYVSIGISPNLEWHLFWVQE